MKFTLKLIAIVLILSLQIAFSQNTAEQKFRLAQSYEQNGNLENAGRIYKELHKEVPMSDKYFGSYVRVFKSLNKFSELIDDAKAQAERKPLVSNTTLVAELYWRIGKSDSANIYWQESIEKAKQPLDYIDISQSQVQLRQFEKAIETLKKGRDNLRSDDAFSDELSRLYIAVGDYKNGIEEIIKHFYERKNTGIAQGRIYALLEIDGSKEYVTEYLEDYVSKNSSDLLLLELYSSFLREINNYEKALNIILKLDNLKKAQGREVLNFARLAASEGKYDIAIKAYKMIVDEGKKNRYTPNALIGMTNALERSMMANDKLSEDEANEIIKSYRKVVEEYSNTSHAQQANFRIGSILFERLNDNEKAIKEFQKTIEMNNRSTYAADASIMIGKIYIMEDELLKAKDIFTGIATGSIGGNNQDYIKEAKYYLGEIQFFKGNFDAAMSFYSDLSGKSDSYVANDALFKSGLIETNKEDFKAMNLFAEAIYAEFRKDTAKALETYQELIEKAPYSQLSEIANLNSADIYYDNNNFDDAINFYRNIINNYDESIYLEKAYFRIALSYMNQNKKELAIQYFKDILVKYPNSIYLQDSRKYIRKLRGEEI